MEGFMETLSLVFNITMVRSTIRAATPILYAMLACVLTQQANILNIGIEGIMIFAAFSAVTASYFLGSWVMGLLAAILTGVVVAAFMAFAHLKAKADIFVTGMGVNMLAIALTRFLLQRTFGVSGSFHHPDIVPMPRFRFDFGGNRILDALFNDYSLFEPVGIVLVFVLFYILYKTVWGLRLRSVGLNPPAAATAGINVTARKFEVMLYSGVLGGIAGAHLSLGYSRMFVENMTNGRGFMGVAAMFFGGANPFWGWIGCLIFGFADSAGARLQALGLPSQFILMIPYVVTVAVLTLAMMRKRRAETARKSAI